MRHQRKRARRPLGDCRDLPAPEDPTNGFRKGFLAPADGPQPGWGFVRDPQYCATCDGGERVLLPEPSCSLTAVVGQRRSTVLDSSGSGHDSC